MIDTQQMELVGRHRLIEQLILSGLEVALPIRDCGVDLLVYSGAAEDDFDAFPIQLKAASGETFSIARKYAKFDRLVLAFTWHITEPARTTMLAMTYAESLAVAHDMKYTDTASWRNDGNYSVTRISERLRTRLEPFFVEPRGWAAARELWKLDPVHAAAPDSQANPRYRDLLRAWLARQGVPMNADDIEPAWDVALHDAQTAFERGNAFHCTERQRVRRILTVHERQNRFVEGHWATLAESGHLLALVRSLAAAQ